MSRLSKIEIEDTNNGFVIKSLDSANKLKDKFSYSNVTPDDYENAISSIFADMIPEILEIKNVNVGYKYNLEITDTVVHELNIVPSESVYGIISFKSINRVSGSLSKLLLTDNLETDHVTKINKIHLYRDYLNNVDKLNEVMYTPGQPIDLFDGLSDVSLNESVKYIIAIELNQSSIVSNEVVEFTINADSFDVDKLYFPESVITTMINTAP